MNPPSYDETMKSYAPSAPEFPNQAPYPTNGPGMPMPQTAPYPTGPNMPMPMPGAGYPNLPPVGNTQSHIMYQIPSNPPMMAQVVITNQHSMPTVQTYATQQGNNQTMVLIQEPKMRSGSQRMICPFCRADIKTRVQSVGSSSCKLITATSCFLGFLFGCCCIGLIPCLLLRKQKHFCPVCNVYLGEYNPIVCGP